MKVIKFIYKLFLIVLSLAFILSGALYFIWVSIIHIEVYLGLVAMVLGVFLGMFCLSLAPED